MHEALEPGIWAPVAQAHRRRAAAMRSRAEHLFSLDGHHLSGEASPPDVREHLTPLMVESQTRTTARRSVEAALAEAAQLPPAEEGISRPRLPLRIGMICDRFLHDTFTGLADLIPLTPVNWREHLQDVDILFVAATWRGHDGASWEVTGPQARGRRRLLIEELIPAYRRAGVPTVYYGKEDPPDYRQFLEVARACEHILTTAAEVVEDYRRDCPEAQSVDVLPFAVNPLLHSPIGSRSPTPGEFDLRERPVIFAGSWMGRKYPQRAAYGRWILDGILQAGLPLAIVDRHHDVETPSPNQLLPFQYWPYRVPAVDHRELTGLQRVTDIAVNLNSVLASQTMFANRALELQAAGTLVLSTYNQGLNSYYPQVHMANSAAEVAAELQSLDLKTLRRSQGDGIRQVFLENHGIDLLAHMARIAGVDVGPSAERILAVRTDPVAEENSQTTEQLRADLTSQTRGPVELVAWEELPARLEDVDILLPVSARRRYEPDYAGDHAAAFRLQGAAVAVKLDGDAATTDAHAQQHRPSHEGSPLELTGLWRPALTVGTQALASPKAAGSALVGQRSYMLDHLQHRPVRRERVEIRDADSPTTSEEDLESARRRFRRTAEDHALTLTVIVPVFNNGHHLRHRAFASLRRAASFAHMHVLLIDDGSTDGVTAAIVDELTRLHPNVSAFHHAPGGSGSASRPRNTGLDLTATPFVTYLDPDDEQHEDGYGHLMERLQDTDGADFALGTQITWNADRMVLDVHRWLSPGTEEIDGLQHPHPGTLRATSFRPASIESMVARTDWLKGLGLTQPEGATGQDTLFFQQLLFHTRAYLAVDRPAYIYYGAVDTSIVNVVTPRYFEKYLIVESARATWLREVGLLQDYVETRLEHFLVTWYLAKLERVATAQRAEAAAIVRRIIGCYVTDVAHHRWRTPEALMFFGLATPQQVLRGRLPKPAALRPALGRSRRRVRSEAALRLAAFRRTTPGRLLGAVYRRTVKPRPRQQSQMITHLREDQRRLESPDGPLETVMAAEAQAEGARRRRVQRRDSGADTP